MDLVRNFVVSLFSNGATKVKFAAGLFSELLQAGIVSTGILFLSKVLRVLQGDIAKKVSTAFIT